MVEDSFEEMAYRLGVQHALKAITQATKGQPRIRTMFVEAVSRLLTSKTNAIWWRRLNPKPDRDDLGRMVRDASVNAILKIKVRVPPGKPVPYERLTETEQEIFRQVGEVLFEAGYVAMRDKLITQLRIDAMELDRNAEALKQFGEHKESKVRKQVAAALRIWAAVYARYGEVERMQKLAQETKALVEQIKRAKKK